MGTSTADATSDDYPWPSPGDLVVHVLGGAPGIPKRIEVALWLGNDYPRQVDKAYLYLAEDGTVCRTFSTQNFTVVGRFSEAVG